MKILRSSEMTPLKAYAMANSSDIGKLSDEENGAVLEIANYLLRSDVDNRSGELKEVLTIQEKDGTLYATNSPTFIRTFFDFVDFLRENDIPEDEHLKICVVHGTSKNGRAFISCNAVVE